MKRTTLANGIGKGVLAGVAGTAAMTVSSTVEAKLRGREFSTAPAKAAAKVLGIETFDDGAAYSPLLEPRPLGLRHRLGRRPRRHARELGVRPRLATPAHFARAVGLGALLAAEVDVAPPVTQWERQDVAIDVFHHLVYAAATGFAYGRLGGRD